jgi:hypothetical protein
MVCGEQFFRLPQTAKLCLVADWCAVRTLQPNGNGAEQQVGCAPRTIWFSHSGCLKGGKPFLHTVFQAAFSGCFFRLLFQAACAVAAA